MEKKKRLSLCIVTKNDEKHIEECLYNMQGIADQIIVVDTGSDDATVEIAKLSGAEVYQMEWKNDCSEARNLCMDYAEGRWILFLNADEIISEEQLKELDLIMKNPNAEGYLMYISRSHEDNLLFYPAQELRLVRNRSEYRYKYKVFERIPDDILTNVEDSYIQIVKRTGEASSAGDNTDILLLEQELIEHPDDSYLQYMYGILLLKLEMYEESTVYFQRAVENVNYEYLFAPHLFKCLSWSLIYLKRYTEAIPMLDEGIKAFPFYSDLLVLRGELHKELKQYNEAIRDLEGSLRIRIRPDYTIYPQEIDDLTILEILGGVHELAENYRQALACYCHAYELDNNNIELSGKINELVQRVEKSEGIN